ncbi:MAG: 3-dehydroquinate synthase, partial [Planctomycetota bacterium]|nr:3-dehydroquinate synthase [Planctomycetota bacterium]
MSSEENELGRWGRLLIQDKAATVRYSIPLTAPLPPEPCHPGCFPAGTQIQSPTGTRAVDSLRSGDVVTTVRADGTSGQGIVASVFVTMNRLIEVRTEESTLTTTETQPLALAEGGLLAAGELKLGDRIYMWDGRERRAVVVRSVNPTGQDARVFNLILGEPVLFIANGFLARSKPPAHT